MFSERTQNETKYKKWNHHFKLKVRKRENYGRE